MEELTCKNCGGHLKEIGFGKYKCEYCGTVYQTEDRFGGFIEVAQSPTNRLRAEVAVPFQARDYMKSEDLSKYTVQELSAKLAEGLAGYMKVTVNEDPFRMVTIVRGEVRVVPPDFRF